MTNKLMGSEMTKLELLLSYVVAVFVIYLLMTNEAKEAAFIVAFLWGIIGAVLYATKVSK
jgi:hypothetical protein